MQLEDLYKPVWPELTAVDAKLFSELKSNSKIISNISQYILAAPGKRLRPALTLLSAKVGNSDIAPAVSLAAAIELIHTATLVQDDVVDQAEIRRAQKSVPKVYGENIAILFGDYLYSQAFNLLASLKDFRVLAILSKVSNVMAAGEIEQLHSAGEAISENRYFEIIQKKTANLFSACCETGGIIGRLAEDQVRALADFGLNFGMAFQIVDDCLDQAASVSETKKTTGLDEKMHMITLPKIYNSLDRAIDKAQEYTRLAQTALDDRLPLAIKNSLVDLSDFVVQQVR